MCNQARWRVTRGSATGSLTAKDFLSRKPRKVDDAVRLTLTSTSDAKTALETAEFCQELGADRVVVLPPKGELDGALPDELARFRDQVIAKLG